MITISNSGPCCKAGLLDNVITTVYFFSPCDLSDPCDHNDPSDLRYPSDPLLVILLILMVSMV